MQKSAALDRHGVSLEPPLGQLSTKATPIAGRCEGDAAFQPPAKGLTGPVSWARLSKQKVAGFADAESQNE
jgi:hypothetical protein